MYVYKILNRNKIIVYIFISFLSFTMLFASSLSKGNLGAGTAIELLFTANLNGSIENCNCGNPPLGGLDYLSTLIKERRTRPYPVLYIDGGDYFNSYPYAELDEAAVRILKILQPDGLVPGEQEFQEDKGIVKNLFNATNILGTNFRYNDFPENKILRRDLPNDKKLLLLGYLSPQSFPGQIPEKLAFSERKFRQVYDALQKNTILVVVFHGTKSALDRFVTLYPKTDLILWAHEQSRRTDLSSRPPIVGGGSDGEHLVVVDISLDKKELHVLVERVPVSKKIVSDRVVKKIIESFNQKIKP